MAIEGPIIGCYLHGSLAMGGFNPDKSDIDLLLITEQPISSKAKKRLANLFLKKSKHPYSVEISILNTSQVANWQYPTPYDFHWSEFWREAIEQELLEDTALFINEKEKKDADLAAHFMILEKRGICLAGSPIPQVFPPVPEADYLSSILVDYEECLENIKQKPVYCILNLLRVFWYLKDGTISSKKEAGDWGMSHLPESYQPIVKQAARSYGNRQAEATFNQSDLLRLRDHIDKNVEEMLEKRNGGS